MKTLIPALFTAVLLSGGMAMTTGVAAEQGMMGMHGKGMQGMHGKGMGHGGGAHSWKSTLSDDQQKQYAKIKLDFKKKVLPIKAKIKQAKIEKALLMTTDKPDQKAINKKIDEILKLKGQKMRLKTEYKLNVRKILNEEQRVQFDLYLLKKASHGKRGKRHH